MTAAHESRLSPIRLRLAQWRAQFPWGSGRRRPDYWWLWSCASLAALAVVVANTAILLQFRQAALDDSRADAVTLSRVYAEATDRTFQSVDLFVSALTDVLSPLAAKGGDAFHEAVSTRATGDLIIGKRGGLPQLAALAVIDAKGNLLISTGGQPGTPVNVADRDYFTMMRDHPELDRYISSPAPNRATGISSIFLAHRLRAADGTFAGLVVGAIRVDYLQDFYRAAAHGDEDIVALWRNDGTLLLNDAAASDTGAAAPSGGTFSDLVAGDPVARGQAQVVRAPIGPDAAPTIVASQPLHNYPLALTVAIPEAAALVRWRKEALVIGIAAVAGIVGIGLVAALVRRHLIAVSQVAAARKDVDVEAYARVQLEQAVTRAEEAVREHERAETALRESEQRFRDVAEVGADTIWETGPDHRFTFFSGGSTQEIESRIGVRVSHIIGKTRWELAAGDPKSDNVWRAHKADLDAHRPFRRFRYRITAATGAPVYYVVSGKPNFDENGQFTGYRGTGTNETEIVEAHSRAERAEEMLRDAVESISEGFVIYDKDDRLALCNEAFLNLYTNRRDVLVPGNTFEEILRDGLNRGIYADAIGHEEEWFKERVESHLHPPGPIEARHSSGRWLLICERPMRGGGIAGLRIDITALKAVQQRLRDNEERLNRAQRQARLGSDTRDLRTGQMVWSDETYRILGVTRENFVPTTESLLACVHPADRKLILDARAESAAGKCPAPFEYRAIRPDGTIRHIHRESELIYDEHGLPVMLAGTIRDITDLRASQARQGELERQLQHSTKMKALGTLAGGIAHDLNNSLVPILSLSKMIAERMPADSDEREDLETITFASERARDLLQQLLDFSRNQMTVKKGVDLGAVVHRSLQMIRATLPANVRLVEEIEAVPALQGDGGQLERVVANLVTNSIQAIGEQPGIVTVGVAPAAAVDWPGELGPPGGGAVVLSVGDTGCGMDAATVERIFEPFYTTKRVGEGTGLGLSVVHGIVTDHGGHIDVQSKRRRGTVFKIVLPLAGPQNEPIADLVQVALEPGELVENPV
ncbi:MAG TPA: ATP-binding protein [Stellaceae bacterium]|jgi:signal transduction histidine kinase